MEKQPGPGRPVGPGGGKFRISFNCEDQGDLGGKTFAFVSDFCTFPSSPSTPHHSPRALTTAGRGGSVRRLEPPQPPQPCPPPQRAFLGPDPRGPPGWDSPPACGLAAGGPAAHTAPLCTSRAGPRPGSAAITYFLNPTMCAFGLVAPG